MYAFTANLKVKVLEQMQIRLLLVLVLNSSTVMQRKHSKIKNNKKETFNKRNDCDTL